MTGLFAAAVVGALAWVVSTRPPEPTPPPAPPPQKEAPLEDGARLMPPAESGLQLYTDAQIGFLLYYPEGVTPIEDRGRMAELGYIPVCDPELSIVCFPYGKEDDAGTNFESAAFSVGIRGKITKESECLVPQDGEAAVGAVMINDSVFASFRYGSAATSHRLEGMHYRHFRDGRCFELSTRIASTVFEVWEPGSIEEFTAADRRTVQDVLDRMLTSFRFQADLELL